MSKQTPLAPTDSLFATVTIDAEAHHNEPHPAALAAVAATGISCNLSLHLFPNGREVNAQPRPFFLGTPVLFTTIRIALSSRCRPALDLADKHGLRDRSP